MLFDNDLIFSEAQAVTATAASTVIDCGQAILTTGLNGGMNLFAVALATTDFTGSGTIDVQLQHSDASGGTFTTVASSGPIVATDIAAVKIPMPLAHKRYLRLNYVVSGTVATGKITAGITTSCDAQQDYKAEDYAFQ